MSLPVVYRRKLGRNLAAGFRPYSKLFAALVEKHRDDLITSRLNEIYGPGRESSPLE